MVGVGDVLPMVQHDIPTEARTRRAPIRSAWVVVRVTPAERARLALRAAESEVTISELVRAILASVNDREADARAHT